MDLEKKLSYLKRMGIETYQPRAAAVEAVAAETTAGTAPEVTSETALSPAAASAPSADDAAWQTLEDEVRECRRCGLCEGRTQTVFGCGSKRAEWMLIGEAPGFEEDRQGFPFVGRAGQLLTKMLKAIGFERDDVYIANTIKCRPPENRNPHTEEIMQCNGYLQRQIALVQPKLILVLGGVAASTLLGVQTPVGKLRGRLHTLPDTQIPLIVTYHPAYLLRSPQQKRAAWDDLQLACRAVDRVPP